MNELVEISNVKANNWKSFLRVEMILCVVTVLSAIVYLMAMMADGMLFEQIGNLKNLISTDKWLNFFNPFLWLYQGLGVFDDVLSASGVWLATLSAVVLGFVSGQTKSVWKTVTYVALSLGLVMQFCAIFSQITCTDIGSVIGRTLKLSPYFVSAMAIGFVTVATNIKKMPPVIPSIAACFAVLPMMVVGISSTTDWLSQVSYAISYNLGTLFNVGLLGLGDALVLVCQSIVLTVAISCVCAVELRRAITAEKGKAA